MNIWDKLAKAVVVLLLMAGVLAVGVWYLPLIQQNQRLRQEHIRLQMEIQNENERYKSLRASVEAGHKDRKTIERLIRRYLGYASPDETVVRFETPAPSPSPRQ